MSEEQPETSQESQEPVVGLAELVALRRIPDNHAHALYLYVGSDTEMGISKWDETYQEFMLRPTGMSKEQWHEKFLETKGEVK